MATPNPRAIAPAERVSYNASTGDAVMGMRVFPNADGSECIFTVYQRPNMSPAMFTEDAKAVARDLATLKALLEP